MTRLGVPYAPVNLDDGTRTCPICEERIAETYDPTGESETNHYGEHFATEHDVEVTFDEFRALVEKGLRRD